MMATGYVHPVADGKVTTLREFALLCARGMMALVTMRDEPLDAPIPDQLEPNTAHHDEKLATAKADMERIAGLSVADARKAAAEDYDARLKEYRDWQSSANAEMSRCQAMLERVNAWEGGPEGLKTFMVEQLNRSIGDGKPVQYDAPVMKTADEWQADALRRASRDVAYHTVEREKEIHRTEERNKWLADLRRSLPPPVSA